MVAAGNSVLLMDSENSAFYIKSTDASGMPMPLRVFDYTERTGTEKVTQTVQESSVQFATKEELAALAARLDALTAQKQTDKEDESNAYPIFQILSGGNSQSNMMQQFLQAVHESNERQGPKRYD